MKKFLIITLLLLLIPLALAAPNIDVEKTEVSKTIVAELDNPAVFNFKIKNNGPADNFEIYSLLSVKMWPKGFFKIENGSTTDIEVRAFPAKEFRENLGLFKFQYEIRGKNSGIFKDELLLNIVSLEEIIEIEAVPFSPESESVTIIIKNTENTFLENLEIDFYSAFFIESIILSLEPFEEFPIKISLDKNQLKGVQAGAYIITAEIPLENKTIAIEEVINYLERESTSTGKISEGIIIKKSIITKTNEGNTPVLTSIDVKKDIISRLFTLTSPEPLTTKREGMFVTYTWIKTINPTDKFSVQVTTNYTIPFVILLVIILLAIAVWKQTTKSVSISKKVSLVKTKKGEFALKVNLNIKSRKTLHNVRVVDMLPPMTKLYEKFGRLPDKVDPKTRRLYWEFKTLGKGEKRILSYIIYSKMNIVGRFELPHALALYEHEGTTKEVLSNRAYFATEERD